MLRGEVYNTAKAREEALIDAECRLVREGHTDTVCLSLKQIKIMPELFQPRMSSYDGHSFDREGHKPSIRLRPNQIKMKPELFQPRTITFGLRPTEDSHVQVLIQAIRADETPPQPVVIKLKDEGYVVVDEHHTVTAYRRRVRRVHHRRAHGFRGPSNLPHAARP